MKRTPTITVFKSEDICFKYENDQFSVFATRNIAKDALVLMEHVVCTDKRDQNMLIMAVGFSHELFNSLYPRTSKLSKELSNAEFLEMCTQKVQKNAFGDKETLSLGLDVSKFNHSDDFNCSVHSTLHSSDSPENVQIMSVCATRNIMRGEELVIYYANGEFGQTGKHDVACPQNTANVIYSHITKYLDSWACRRLAMFHKTLALRKG